ncbi:MAG: hypothetical protein HYY46_23685 [Deltaproteobacteria bacterium]|nr:hypothetical protein [Deltaproteobacteria bacterium]
MIHIPSSMTEPEDQARENIDRMLTRSGWAMRDQGDAHISAYRALAIRNFTLKQGHGFADYLLYVELRRLTTLPRHFKKALRSPSSSKMSSRALPREVHGRSHRQIPL